MKFENLSKSAKIRYWQEVGNDIVSCLSLCESHLPDDLIIQIRHYLSHNELGIAIELLLDTLIDKDSHIAEEAKFSILKTLQRMNYNQSDPEQYKSYEQFLGPRQ